MANSKYEYTRTYEQDDSLVKDAWIVVRLDGRGFHKFSDLHGFEKPNDIRALQLMDACASALMKEFNDIILAYGQSDEYSFILNRTSMLYSRRSSKIISSMVSLFTANYVYLWANYFSHTPLRYPPSFDARAVIYAQNKTLRDYLSWRQSDCHINNLYNTCFWALVNQGNMSTTQAEDRLKGTLSAEKNEILFTQFNINYAKLDERYRKGSVVLWQKIPRSEKSMRHHKDILILHVDIIRDRFWEEDYPDILNDD